MARNTRGVNKWFIRVNSMGWWLIDGQSIVSHWLLVVNNAGVDSN